MEGCGTIQVFMELEHGRIQNCQFYGDFFGQGASPQLLQQLKDCPLEYQALLHALAPIDVERCFYHLTREDLAAILMQ